MAYSKQQWQDGDIITAEKLNHMEDGIKASNGVMVITPYWDDDGIMKSNYTYEEILDAGYNGQIVILQFGETSYQSKSYLLTSLGMGGPITFTYTDVELRPDNKCYLNALVATVDQNNVVEETTSLTIDLTSLQI